MPTTAVGTEKPSFFEALYAATDADACEVVDGLFLGAASAASDRKAMLKRRISHVLIAHPALAEQHPKNFQYFRVPVLDEPTANLLELLPNALGFLAEARSTGGRAFVYCAKGISRSASIVIALLMLERGVSFGEAFALCEKKRPVAYPNIGFQQQLKQLEALLPPTTAGTWQERLRHLRRAVPTGSPLQLQASLDSQASTGLQALEELIEQVLARPSLLQGRELWKCHGLLFENLHKYRARAGDPALIQRARDDAARLRTLPRIFSGSLRGVQLALGVAQELEAWAALEPPARATVPETGSAGSQGQGAVAAVKRSQERSRSRCREEKEVRSKGKKANKANKEEKAGKEDKASKEGKGGKEDKGSKEDRKLERRLERKLAKVERRAREAEHAALAEFRLAEEAARRADEAAVELDKAEAEEQFERRAALAGERAGGRPGARCTERSQRAGSSDRSDCSGRS